ncbi:MAG: M13 family metallopeptidase [Butyrivibrio sp.]|nr:M13 family metallopeptidase [Butyrivibrio sp.]
MKRKLNKNFARGMAFLLSTSMIGGVVGCGDAKTETKIETETEKETVATVENSSTDEIVDNNTYITDFDEYVNGEWKKQKEQENNGSAAFWWDEQKQSDERLWDILDNTDLNGISEEEGLFKAVSIYRNILDTQDYDQRMDSIKEHLAPIENVATLDDIYNLFQNEEYLLYSGAFNFVITADDNGYNATIFSPESMMSSIEFQKGLITGDAGDEKAREDFSALMEKLGYSDDRTAQMLDNAAIVGQMIDGYWNKTVSYNTVYFDSKTLNEENVSMPVIELLSATKSLGRNKDFIAKENFSELINALYQEDNVQVLRDHMLIGAISKLLPVCGSNYIKSAYGTEYKDVAYSSITKYAPDVINEAYNEKYLDNFDEQRAMEMVEDIKDGYREIISEAEWLGTHGKELANHKILTMRVSLGKNEAQNDLSDVELTGDIVDDYISLLVSYGRFARSQVGLEDDKRQIFYANPFEVNARFIYKLNALYATSGLLSSPYCSKDASYEEMLAYYGMIIAHEYGHSYDPQGINYDWRGWWETWMQEDEEAAYLEKQQKIADFFNGMEVEYGRKIDGELIKNEAYADIMAMQCCLKILEKRENPDYDLFFRTYAMKNAYYITEQDIDNAMADDHLISTERINHILGQFDKFYETYNIDENSPYYVPKEQRLTAF